MERIGSKSKRELPKMTSRRSIASGTNEWVPTLNLSARRFRFFGFSILRLGQRFSIKGHPCCYTDRKSRRTTGRRRASTSCNSTSTFDEGEFDALADGVDALGADVDGVAEVPGALGGGFGAAAFAFACCAARGFVAAAGAIGVDHGAAAW